MVFCNVSSVQPSGHWKGNHTKNVAHSVACHQDCNRLLLVYMHISTTVGWGVKRGRTWLFYVMFILPSEEPFLVLLGTQTSVQCRDAPSSVGPCKDATLNNICPWPIQHLFLHPHYLKDSSVWLILHLRKVLLLLFFLCHLRPCKLWRKGSYLLYKHAWFVGYTVTA